jgi:RND family efflux transporter MFP subunit
LELFMNPIRAGQPVARTVLLGAAMVAFMALAACKPESPPPAVPEQAALKTAGVELREVDDAYTSDAVVEAVRQSTVSAQIAGRVVDLRFDVGDYVKRGEVIVRIDERAVAQVAAASEAQVQEASAALANARAQLERTRALVAQKFLSPSALDQAESAAKAAQARVTALLAGAGAAATERSFATIVAPYSGVVSARHVEVGEMATPGKPLMTGFDPTTLRVVATVPQTQIAGIQAGIQAGNATGRAARVEIPSAGRWLEVKSVTVVPAADPRTHTTRVRLELKDETVKEGLRGVYPGVFARAHFVTGKATRLMVPREAIVRRSEVTAVYVVDERGAPQLRQIRPGSVADDRGIEVLAGLKAGERVALEPIAAGMASTRSVVPAKAGIQ